MRNLINKMMLALSLLSCAPTACDVAQDVGDGEIRVLVCDPEMPKCGDEEDMTQETLDVLDEVEQILDRPVVPTNDPDGAITIIFTHNYGDKVTGRHVESPDPCFEVVQSPPDAHATAHEIAHALGLGHVQCGDTLEECKASENSSSLMAPYALGGEDLSTGEMDTVDEGIDRLTACRDKN